MVQCGRMHFGVSYRRLWLHGPKSGPVHTHLQLWLSPGPRGGKLITLSRTARPAELNQAPTNLTIQPHLIHARSLVLFQPVAFDINHHRPSDAAIA